MLIAELSLSCLYARLTFILFILVVVSPAGGANPPPKMRPYSGIGLVLFAQHTTAIRNLDLTLYAEPGLVRVGALNDPRLRGNEWVFELPGETQPLIVSARKREWLRIYYDDAGREAWVDPHSRAQFVTWEWFLKQRSAFMLPGLQKRYYQLFHQTERTPLATLKAKQAFRVLKLEQDWCMVLISQSQIGWLRWRDEDGRLLIGVSK